MTAMSDAFTTVTVTAAIFLLVASVQLLILTSLLPSKVDTESPCNAYLFNHVRLTFYSKSFNGGLACRSLGLVFLYGFGSHMRVGHLVQNAWD